MKVAGGCQHPDMTLVKMCSPSLLSWASWVGGKGGPEQGRGLPQLPLETEAKPRPQPRSPEAHIQLHFGAESCCRPSWLHSFGKWFLFLEPRFPLPLATP